VETQPETPVAPPEPRRPSVRREPKRLCGAGHRTARFGQDDVVRRRGVTPLSSDLLRNILFDDVEEQRYQGLVFSTLRSLLRARLIAQDAVELRGRDEPVDARAQAVDQDGQELRLRGAGGLLRRAAGRLPGAQQQARPLR
jgi:hypothetical protein